MSNIVDLEDDVGHSLPNAEDAKTEAAILGVGRSRRRLLYIVAGILVVVLAILIPVSITMSGGSKSSANLQTGQDQNGQNQNRQDPPIIEIDPDREHDDKQEEIEDDSGRDGPASESSTLRGELDPTRFTDVVAFLSDYSDEVSLGTAGEPQNTAATWIAEFDYLKLPIPEDPDSPEAYRFMQRYVLVLLFQAMNGDEWDYRVNFQTHMSECEWAQGFGTGQDSYQLGVTCDENGFITKLLMPGNGLSGEIYDEIGWLTSMTHLSLFSNDITGEIPDLSLLTDLVFLAMESNELSGAIPEWIGELTALQYLALGDNLLSGELPETMANLVSLQEVALDENQLSGDISVLADLPAIRRLYLGHNTFQGEINEDFLATSEVFELDLADNQFTGIIPGHFFSRNKLEVLDMHSNQIGGNLPQDIDRNDRLKFLSLYDNQISGAMPSDITKWEAVTHLDLSDNAFTGAMPTDLELMTNLRYLYLANNAFTEGPILDLSLLTGLHELSLKNTQRTGNIPDDVNKLQVLVLLDLDGNSLSGQIPATLGSLADLRYLLLNRNQFTGSIPDSFMGLESIDLLLLDNNALTGDDAPICGPDGPGAPSSFITDCVVQCECCSLCCDADDTDCYDDDDLLANIDYAWEAGYRRDAYVFSEDIIFRTNV